MKAADDLRLEVVCCEGVSVGKWLLCQHSYLNNRKFLESGIIISGSTGLQVGWRIALGPPSQQITSSLRSSAAFNVGGSHYYFVA